MALTNSTSRADTPTEGTGGHELDAPPWLRVESTLMATARAIHDAYDHRLAPLDLSLNTASLLAYVAGTALIYLKPKIYQSTTVFELLELYPGENPQPPSIAAEARDPWTMDAP